MQFSSSDKVFPEIAEMCHQCHQLSRAVSPWPLVTVSPGHHADIDTSWENEKSSDNKNFTVDKMFPDVTNMMKQM